MLLVSVTDQIREGHSEEMEWYCLPELISCPVFGWTSFSDVDRHSSSSDGVWPLAATCDLRKVAIAESENTTTNSIQNSQSEYNSKRLVKWIVPQALRRTAEPL